VPAFRLRQSGISDSDNAIPKLAQSLGVSHVLAKLLVNRSIVEPAEAERFLNPSFEHLHDPFLFRDMAKAVERIKRAIAGGESITVYGDYDVDGITACAVMYQYLNGRNVDVKVYIPSRHAEGYGLNAEAISSIAQSGTTLIITVDCGVTASEEVLKAKSLGIDVIITDHHICARQKPGAFAVIATSDESDTYPFKDLCGAGIAAKLVQALGGMEALESVIDLAAVGTVADMVPLLGENRVFVAKGLQKMSLNPRTGIEALIKVAGFDKKEVDSGKISFALAPRLNASGRMALAQAGFNLLISENADEALKIAKTLNEHNVLRQKLEEQLVNEVKNKIEKELNLSDDRIIVIEGENWHKGVIGIAASKIVEAYNRPCLLISIKDGKGAGSARSISGFDVFDALTKVRHLFEKLGGHAKAAGFSLTASNIPLLKQALSEYARLNITDEMITKKAVYDERIMFSDITPQLVNEIEKLAPFGMANPSPAFLFGDAIMEDGRYLGNDLRHVKFSFRAEQKIWEGIGFGLAHVLGGLAGSGAVDVLAGIETNEWMGVSRIQLMVKTLKRVLADQNDIELTLKPFLFKFFDVFLSDVRYNEDVSRQSSVVSRQSSGGSPDVKNRAQSIDGRCQRVDAGIPKINWEDALVGIDRSAIGHLFLASSKMGAKWLLERMIAHNLADEFSAGFGEPDDLSGNAVVIAPDCNKIPFRHYNRIYVLEGEEGLYPKRFFEAEYALRIYAIRTIDEASKIKESYLEHLKIDRVFLTHFYKWLKLKKNGRLIFKDMSDLMEDYNKSSGLGSNGFQVSMAAEIFSELGFIILNAEHRCVKIECVQNPPKRSLNESKIYIGYKSFMRRFDNTTNGGNLNGFETENTHNS
jgi:single-stranded-DNA-specific exonuclease